MSRISSISIPVFAVMLFFGYQAAAVTDSVQIETVSIKVARGMAVGDRVRVSGVVTVQSGAFASSISPGFAVQDDSAEKLTGSGTVTARPVETGDVREAEEGILVRAGGHVTRMKDDPPYGYKVFIDDNSGECQIFVNASTGLVQYARRWRVGDFISLIGFAGQYEKAYEIMPRIPSDIDVRATQE